MPWPDMAVDCRAAVFDFDDPAKYGGDPGRVLKAVLGLWEQG
jgi:hypothetical protein